MKISQEVKLDYDDVLLVPQRSTLESRKDVILNRTFKFYHSDRVFSGFPLMSANMSCVSGFQLAETLQKYKMITCLHKYINYDKLIRLFNAGDLNPNFVWISIGMSDEDILNVKKLTENTDTIPNICIDVANGYTEKFIDFCQKVRDNFPSSILMGGNVCTPEIVQELILKALDIVKINVGPGSACTSRAVAAVGYPSLSAIDECSHAAHGLKSGSGHLGLICSDGGLKHSGDLSKGFCAGADFLMSGQLFAAHDENSDVCEWEGENENRYAIYYGMSSHYSQNKHSEGRKDYRASEGTVRKIKYKGSVVTTIEELQGGIRSTGAYIGANCLKDFAKCASFIRVNRIHQNYGNQILGL